MPKTAEVYNQDHDHSEFETNGPTRCVDLREKEYAEEWDKDTDGYEDMPDVWVTIAV